MIIFILGRRRILLIFDKYKKGCRFIPTLRDRREGNYLICQGKWLCEHEIIKLKKDINTKTKK
jgi:hypothetical protein